MRHSHQIAALLFALLTLACASSEAGHERDSTGFLRRRASRVFPARAHRGEDAYAALQYRARSGVLVNKRAPQAGPSPLPGSATCPINEEVQAGACVCRATYGRSTSGSCVACSQIYRIAGAGAVCGGCVVGRTDVNGACTCSAGTQANAAGVCEAIPPTTPAISTFSVSSPASASVTPGTTVVASVSFTLVDLATGGTYTISAVDTSPGGTRRLRTRVAGDELANSGPLPASTTGTTTGQLVFNSKTAKSYQIVVTVSAPSTGGTVSVSETPPSLQCLSGAAAVNGVCVCSNGAVYSPSTGCVVVPGCLAGATVVNGACVCSSSVPYSATTGCAATTVTCPAGTEPSNGACTPCSSGTASAGGTALCAPCPAGSIPNMVKSGCSPCAAGSSSTTGGNACTQCPSGTVSLEGGLCAACTGATVFVDGRCASCPGGTIPNAVHLACIPCSPNLYSNGEICSPCPAGSASAPMSANCYLCAAGSTSTAGGSCTICPGNTYSAAGGLCTACPAGQLANSSKTSCLRCAVNEYLSGGACVICPAGFVAPAGSTSLAACTACPAGSAVINGSCIRCPAGSFSSASSSTFCSTCPAGKFSAATGATSCDICPAGTSSGPGAATCQACAPYTYSIGGTQCGACPGGLTPNPSQTTCVACPVNTYKETGDTGPCRACPSGSTSSGGTNLLAGCLACSPGSAVINEVCTSCSPGTFSATAGSTSCTSCPAGTSSGQGVTSCSACVGESYSVAGGLCTPCSNGLVANSGKTACVAPTTTNCAINEYASAGSCSPCPLGSTSPAGSSSAAACTPCSAGSAVVAGVCRPCDAGRYSATSGSISCTPCPAGRSARETGSTSCNSCTGNTYSAQAGATSCQECDMNTFPNAGHTSCAAVTCIQYAQPDASGMCHCGGGDGSMGYFLGECKTCGNIGRADGAQLDFAGAPAYSETCGNCDAPGYSPIADGTCVEDSP